MQPETGEPEVGHRFLHRRERHRVVPQLAVDDASGPLSPRGRRGAAASGGGRAGGTARDGGGAARRRRAWRRRARCRRRAARCAGRRRPVPGSANTENSSSGSSRGAAVGLLGGEVGERTDVGQDRSHRGPAGRVEPAVQALGDEDVGLAERAARPRATVEPLVAEGELDPPAARVGRPEVQRPPSGGVSDDCGDRGVERDRSGPALGRTSWASSTGAPPDVGGHRRRCGAETGASVYRCA